MQQVAALLERHEGRQAVRVFLQMLAHEAAPGAVGRRQWVSARIGKERTALLVSAMGSFPCFSCEGGLEGCMVCGGSGFAAAAKVCATCIGTGKGRCDFCNGTGLCTYNLLPADFRAVVLTRRVARGEKTLQKLLPSVRADVAGSAADEVVAAHETRVMYGLNKLLGVLENAIITSRQLARDGLVNEDWPSKVEANVQTHADDARAALRTVLERLAARQQAAAEAKQVDDPIAAEELNDKAEFVRSLLTAGRFEGTMLHHPFLPPQQSS